MKWTEEPAKLTLHNAIGRSAGLHISEVIRDYAVEASVLDRKWITEAAIEDQDTNLMQVGLGWEDYLARYQHPEIEFHPGELYVEDLDFCQCGHDRDVHVRPYVQITQPVCSVVECDCRRFRAQRIYMSPDGISTIDRDDYADLFVKSGYFCHEFKFTRKSSRDFVGQLNQRSPKTLMWIWQIMCYCKAMDTLAAKLHVMFINGDYSRDVKTPGESMAPYKVFRAEFTEEDIENNWIKFKTHARHMRLNRMLSE